MYVKLVISTSINDTIQTINHINQIFNDTKIQLARKIRTDILSLYRKMSSLGAPVTCCSFFNALTSMVLIWILNAFDDAPKEKKNYIQLQ